MATSRFYCYVCLKDFNFSSRYERHIQSSSHQRMEEVLNLQDDTNSRQLASVQSEAHCQQDTENSAVSEVQSFTTEATHEDPAEV